MCATASFSNLFNADFAGHQLGEEQVAGGAKSCILFDAIFDLADTEETLSHSHLVGLG